MPVNNNIMLSIGIMTFNHGAFISTLLDSIIRQKVNFNYEIIITDDASTDQTLEIIKNYKNKYPKKITLFLNEKNKGVIYNAKLLATNSKGKYCCFLDGDDYWIYDYKLQKQTDFLEANPDYYGCFHDAKIVSVNPLKTDSNLYKKQYFNKCTTYSSFNNYTPDFLPQDLINRNIIPTASLIFRKTVFTTFFNEFSDVKLSLNWAVHLFIIKNGKFRYINRQWSVYNDHPGGVSKKYKYSEFINTNITVLKRFKQKPEFKKLKTEIYRSLSREYMFLYHTTKNNKIPLSAIINHIRYRILFLMGKPNKVK